MNRETGREFILNLSFQVELVNAGLSKPMSKRISLSRAAHLAGVKRGTLQQKIRAGELKTFEGEIVLADLLHAYPDTQIEDSSMLDRVEQIMEQATFINADTLRHKPDNVALSARIMSSDVIWVSFIIVIIGEL